MAAILSRRALLPVAVAALGHADTCGYAGVPRCATIRGDPRCSPSGRDIARPDLPMRLLARFVVLVAAVFGLGLAFAWAWDRSDSPPAGGVTPPTRTVH